MHNIRSTTTKRLLAAFVTLAMIWSLVPTLSLADETNPAASLEGAVEAATEPAGEPSAQEQASAGDSKESIDGSVDKPNAAQGDEGVAGQATEQEAGLSAQDDATAISVTVRVIGPDAEGSDGDWLAETAVEIEDGQSAWDASKKAFDDAGLVYEVQDTENGTFLNTITNPTTTKTLGYDEATGKYWKLFVNESAQEEMASSVKPGAEAKIVWRYAKDDASGEETTSEDGDDKSNSDTSFWCGFRNGARRNVETSVALPAAPGELVWRANLKGDAAGVNISDPIIVNHNVYVAVGNELRKLNGSTGEVIEPKQELEASIDSTSRVVYDSGVVMVPLHGGRVQALAADTLTTVWTTDAVPEGADETQSLGTGYAKDGIAYFQTCQGESSNAGYVLAINVADGTEAWTYKNDSAGYYWAGPASAGNALVIADDKGTVWAHNPTTGEVLSQVSLGGPVLSGVASNDDGSAVYVVTRDDGTLHKLEVLGGQLKSAGEVKFASYSTSTPTVSNGKIYVGGKSEDGTGILVVINESDLAVEKNIVAAKDADGVSIVLPGEVKSSPLVSATSAATRVYFTSNEKPGALYVYADGDDEARVLYTPEEQECCLSSPIPTEDGCVIYANDSGNLFKVKGSEAPEPGETPAPDIVCDRGGKFTSRSTVVTFTITQQVPDDATSMLIWSDVDPAMEIVADETQVGVEDGDVWWEGNRVFARVGSVSTEGLDGIGAMAEAAESESSIESLRGQTVTVWYNAKVRDDADLTPYLNDEGNTASIPYSAHVRFNNDDSRVASSEVKHLNIAYSKPKDNAKTGTTSTAAQRAAAATTTSKTATPKTSDQTMGVAAIVVAALVVLGVGLVLRRRAGNSRE